MSQILLCARRGAFELAAIAGALRERGVEPITFDSAAFPSGAPVSLAYDGSSFRGAELADVSAVWHNLVVGTDLPGPGPGMDPGTRETCIAASERALIGLFDSMSVFQVDPVWAKTRADNKPYQLRIAQRMGLEIPQTIITNDAEAVRAFARRCGPVITKMLVQPIGGEGDEADVVFTTALGEDDLAQLDGLELCPMIFQAQIENRRDVRATVVGTRIFAAALERSPEGLDWRRDSYASDRAPVWEPYELPPALGDRLLAMLDHLELQYGAADFVVRPDGSHVFLELNASGSFGFLGEAIARPIAAAIADVLVDPSARRGVEGA